MKFQAKLLTLLTCGAVAMTMPGVSSEGAAPLTRTRGVAVEGSSKRRIVTDDNYCDADDADHDDDADYIDADDDLDDDFDGDDDNDDGNSNSIELLRTANLPVRSGENSILDELRQAASAGITTLNDTAAAEAPVGSAGEDVLLAELRQAAQAPLENSAVENAILEALRLATIPVENNAAAEALKMQSLCEDAEVLMKHMDVVAGAGHGEDESRVHPGGGGIDAADAIGLAVAI